MTDRLRELATHRVAQMVGWSKTEIRKAMLAGDARRKVGGVPTHEEIISWPKRPGSNIMVTVIEEVEAWQLRRRNYGVRQIHRKAPKEDVYSRLK